MSMWSVGLFRRRNGTDFAPRPTTSTTTSTTTTSTSTTTTTTTTAERTTTTTTPTTSTATTTTTTTLDSKHAILALSSFPIPTPTKRHSFFDTLSGEISEGYLSYGTNTESYQSCSVQWRGRMLVFGGWQQRRQISEISGCQLRNVGHLQLPFTFQFGACAALESEILLCFDSSNTHSCWSTSDLSNYEQLETSLFTHQYTRIASR